MANRLIHSTSPYLLQHAHNPVDWYEWGPLALEQAKKEDKPILVSIGYAACHWCHVMERECFEKEDIAKVMNDLFICIKVDREERPDVDQVYMEAVQAMGINGGWPLNVFLTPDQKPFYGGTYFPPPQWNQVLTQLGAAFRQRRKEIDVSAEEITAHLNKSDLQRFATRGDVRFTREILDSMFNILESRFDKEMGGIDKAPKFVMPTIWLFLLRYYQITKKKEALAMVALTLKKMTRGGLYDQLAGGFARYSVDREWFAPHFEKMLYDNGQLLSLYAEMCRVTGEDFYRDIIRETVQWMESEMRHTDGGFYSALDADSEGVEGKFYCWTHDELTDVLGADAEAAIHFFKVDKNGNWEHGQNILMRDESSIPSSLEEWKKKLHAHREKRIRPGLDDKILSGWNLMAIKGMTDAYIALGDPHYLGLAIDAIHFIEQNLMVNGILYRSWKGKHSVTQGFLEDYAFLIQAYLGLYECTQDETWAHQAKVNCNYVMAQFFDPSEGYFFYTSAESETLIARKKEMFDNVIPASNSVMARNLYRLGILFDHEEWKKTGERMLANMLNTVQQEPSYLSNWGILLTEVVNGISEIAIVGPDYKEMTKELGHHYLPFSLLMGSAGTSQLPLLADKTSAKDSTTIFVCYNKSCQLPVTTVEQALKQIR